MEQKEIEKKKLYKLYNEKYIKLSNLAYKLKNNKDKFELVRKKNEYMKILICKLIRENNVMKWIYKYNVDI